MSTGWNGEQLLPALSYNQTVAAAYAAGFRGNALVDAVAIAKRESGFIPNNYNGNVQTGDNSIGMMQINILGTNFNGIETIIANLTGASSALSREQVGQALTDPIMNFRVAYTMSNGGADGFYSWGPYGGQSALRDTDVSSAQTAVNAFLAESSAQQASDIANLHDLNAGSYTNQGNSTDSGGTGIPIVGGIVDGTRTIYDTAGNVIGKVSGAVKGLGALISDADSVLIWSLDWHNWVKMGVILGGVLLILGGIYAAIKGDSNSAGTIAKAGEMAE